MQVSLFVCFAFHHHIITFTTASQIEQHKGKMTTDNSVKEKHGAMSPCVTKLPVSLFGYGRYGRLIVNKYYSRSNTTSSSSKGGWELRAVIDPGFALEDSSMKIDLLEQCPFDVTPPEVFACIDSWIEGYWCKLSDTEKATVVADIALKPDILCSLVTKVVIRCSPHLKFMVLPKPVCETRLEMDHLVQLVAKHGVKTAVASQWAYSRVPGLIGMVCEKARSPVSSVKLDFSKENGHLYETSPPLLEIPHCIQILQSTNLIDFESSTFERRVEGSKDYAMIEYTTTQGVNIVLQADLNRIPSDQERSTKNNHVRKDYQIRTLTAFDHAGINLISVDFWIHFDSTGTRILRHGHVKGSGLELALADDQLMDMIIAIYDGFGRHFGSSMEEYERDPDVCSLTQYSVIGKEIMDIESDWKIAARAEVSPAAVRLLKEKKQFPTDLADTRLMRMQASHHSKQGACTKARMP